MKNYYQLAKPGIIYANVLTAIAGYFLACQWHVQWLVLIPLIVGLATVIASACICNNILDRSIDVRMQRTKQRALVTGAINSKAAGILAATLVISGLTLLAVSQSLIVTVLVAIAFIDYTVLYAWGKRRSPHGTLVGCISGAIPLVAGYVAAHNRLDIGAGLLFLLMVAWQMAHFFGIALTREDDYRQAGIPVMPVAHGQSSTKRQAVVYMLLFIIVASLLGVYGVVRPLVSVLLVGIACYWLLKALHGYQRSSAAVWGRQVFTTSLLVMCVMSLSFVISPLF